jgi:hypothetical protein
MADDDDCNGDEPRRPNFPLGTLVATPGALESLHPEDVAAAVRRHLLGDWGELDDEDRAENERALRDGSRLLSAHRDRHGTGFWVITEADRKATTVLLPDEY